jgi:hypothetical protein
MKSKFKKRIIILSIVLAVLLFCSAGFFTYTTFFMPSSNVTAKLNPLQEQNPMPCVEVGTKIVDDSLIAVRVLNGTKKSGFGQIVSEALKTRGFQLRDAETYGPTASGAPLEYSFIRYGKKAVRLALTLANSFKNPVLILDNRKDYLLDLVIGNDFENLRDAEEVAALQVTGALINPEGCVDLKTIQPVEQLKHIKYVLTPADLGEVNPDATNTDTTNTTGTGSL